MQEQEQKRRRGCLFYVALILGGTFVMTIAVGAAAVVYAKHALDRFTDTEPVALPGPELSQIELEQLNERVRSFQLAIRQRRPVSALVLSADEINALLVSNRQLEPLRDKLRVMIEGNELKGRVSLPLSEIGVPFAKGRYLNGTATFRVQFENGMLRVSPVAMVAKGDPLPGRVMQIASKQNLVQSLYTDPRASVAMEQLKAIEVKDGRLVIVPKEEQ